MAHKVPATRPGRLLFPVVTRLESENRVALTFDDGPDREIGALLDRLEEAKVQATFFVVGEQVERYPDKLREIVRRGHEVGVHCYRHLDHMRLTPELVVEDMHQAREVIEGVTERSIRLFRPPYGRFSLASWLEAGRLGWERILWTLDSTDWAPVATTRSIIDNVGWPRPGDIVLLHCSDRYAAPNSSRNTCGAMPTILERIYSQGLQAGPVGELPRT